MGVVQDTGGIVSILRRPVAHRIERVLDRITRSVADPSQPVRAVIGVEHVAAVREGHLLQEPRRPVAEASGFSPSLTRRQTQSGVVSERRHYPVRIRDCERLAVRAIRVEGGYVAQNIAHRL